MSCAPLVPASRECHPLPLVGLRKIGKVGGRSMPPFTVLFARLSTLSLLSALLVIGLSPGAPASAIYSASTFAGYLNPAASASRTSSGQATNTGTNPTVRVSPGDGKVGATRSVSGSGFEPNQDISLLFDGSTVSTSCSTK